MSGTGKILRAGYAAAILLVAGPVLAQTPAPEDSLPLSEINEPPPAEPATAAPATAAPATAAPATVEPAPVAEPAAPVEAPAVAAPASEPQPAPRAEHGQRPPAGPQSARGAPGFKLGLGIMFDAVDERAIQGLHAPVPQFSLDIRYQFANNLSLFSQIQFIFVMNQIEVGAGWSTRLGKTDIMPYATVGSMLGVLSLGGFDSFTAAPLFRPGIRLGWDVGEYNLTFNGSALFIPAQFVTLGDSSLWTSAFNAFTGLQGTLTLEVPLSGGDIIFFGLAALWMRSWYQTWLFYSDDPSLLLYPRVFLGYVF